MANPHKLLAELGIDKESYRVLGLLPLIYVAWADGSVQRAERSLILETASEKGWLAGGGGEVLARWLTERPSDAEVRSGLEALRLLSEQEGGVGANFHAETLSSLLTLCKQVAEAAGGFLGCTEPIAESEQKALATIADALGIAEGDWRAPDDEVPGPRGGLLLGSALDMKNDLLDLLARSFREYGDAVRLRALGQPFYFFFRPEEVQYILADNADNYRRGRSFEAVAERTGPSMITTEGELWRRLRRTAQPLFKKQHLSRFVGQVVAIAAGMLDDWEARRAEPIDMAKEMSKVTMRVIGQLIFSRDLSDSAGELGKAVDVSVRHVGQVFTNPLMIPDAIPTPANLRFKEATRVFDEFVYGLMRERRAETERPSDLMTMLMEAKDEETGQGLSDAEIRNELLTFLVAGHETTATALMWALYYASTVPMAWRELAAETDHLLAGRAPGLAELDELAYAEWYLQETMRLRPPFPAIGRNAVAEDFIAGYRIPKGADVLVSQWVTHRHPAIWDNPEGFDPERFSPARSEGRHKMAWFPFGAGPHKCIGMALTLLEAKVILPMIAQRYRVELLPGARVDLEVALTVRPKGGLPMRVRPR